MPVSDPVSSHDAAEQVAGLLGDDGDFEETGQDTSETDQEELDDQHDAEEDNEPDDDAEEGEEESEDSDDESANTEDDDSEQLKTFSELAAALEVDIDDLSLTHTFTRDGKEVTLTLKDLVRENQESVGRVKAGEQLAEENRQLEINRQKQVREFEQTSQTNAQYLHAAEQVLSAEFNTQEMQELRQTDQAEFLIREREIGQKLQYLQNVKQQAAQQYEAFNQQQRSQLYERGMKELKDTIPDFGPSHVEKAQSAMETLGYHKDEIANILDPRLVRGALEIAELREKVAAAEKKSSEAKEKVQVLKKTVPKLVKPGKPGSQANMQKSKVAKLQGRFKKAPSVANAASILSELDF